ncbi:MAG: co-chaperone GroES [Actinobacteria bacterium]|nr:co-chaperone GroES [Actinomycetota bacterium]
MKDKRETRLRSIPADSDSRHSIRMTADRILAVTPKEIGERKTRTGILIPATAESESRRALWGEVVAIGPHVRSAEPGDLVLFGPEAAYEVEIRGDAYVVLRERDIHAVASERVEGKSGLYL